VIGTGGVDGTGGGGGFPVGGGGVVVVVVFGVPLPQPASTTLDASSARSEKLLKR
jgi:hypothetical protein